MGDDPERLASGQNRPWSGRLLKAAVTGATPAAVLLDGGRRGVGPTSWVAPDTAQTPGVQVELSAPGGEVTLWLSELPPEVHTVLVVGWELTQAVAIDLRSETATEVVFVPRGLGPERAVILAEVYRRDGGWKVRALGHGYAGGVSELASVHGVVLPVGVDVSPERRHFPPPALAAGPVAVAPALPELDHLVAMILDDAASTTASMASSVAFAEDRLAADLESIAVDPRLRTSSAGRSAQAAARNRHEVLVAAARERHRDDVENLAREVEELNPRLPLACADWSRFEDARGFSRSPVAADGLVRWAELSLLEGPGLRVPLLRQILGGPAVWVYTGDRADTGSLDPAGRVLTSLVNRTILAAPSAPMVTVLSCGDDERYADIATSRPAARGFEAVKAELDSLNHHVDLVTLAAGRLGDLPPQYRVPQVVVVPDFPIGLDDEGARIVLRLARDGARGGVTLLLSGADPAPLGNTMLDSVKGCCFGVLATPESVTMGAEGGVCWVLTPEQGVARDEVAAALFLIAQSRVHEAN